MSETHSAVELSDREQALVRRVRAWVEAEVRPSASQLERTDTYPSFLIKQMREMGLFGLTVPAAYGGSDVSATCFAQVTEEIARGWMSLTGVVGGHSVVCKLILDFGTPAQRHRYLPRLATGAVRATMALTEPDGGSDLQSMRTVAARVADGYVVDGRKTWITNSRRGGLFALLCKTDPLAEPAHRGISILLAEHGPGLTVKRDLPKLGYRGIETCEVEFSAYRVGFDALLGGREGLGFQQIMRGLELARIQVASRALGVGRAALEDSLRYAQERHSFGKPIWQHQSIGNYLADMATQFTAAQQLVRYAAQRYDSGARSDMEAGMAKLFASEMAMNVALTAMRIHGANGYSADFDIERYFRDAPLMILGEGTSEIQRKVITSQLIDRGGVGAQVWSQSPEVSRDAETLSGKAVPDVLERVPVV